MNVQLVCQWILVVLYLIILFGHTAVIIGSDEGINRAKSFGHIIGGFVGCAIVYGAGGFSLTLEQWIK